MLNKITKVFLAMIMGLGIFLNQINPIYAATIYENEPNNSFQYADSFKLGDTINGEITENDNEDIYKFTVPSQGKVTLIMTSYKRWYGIYIYDSNGEKVWYTDYNQWNSSIGYCRNTHEIYLEKGIYYLSTDGYNRSSKNEKSCGKYTLKTSFHYTDSKPSLNVSSKTNTSLKLTWSKMSGANGYEILRSTSKNGTYKKIKTITNGNTLNYVDSGLTLGKTYYYKVRAYKNAGSTKVYSYASSVVSKKVSIPLSKTTIKCTSQMAYTGKALKPNITVKYGDVTLKNGTDYTLTYKNNTNTGKAIVVVKGKGKYSGSVNKYFYIVPKKVSSVSLTSGSKSATVKYAKATGASGYQIAYSTSKTSGFKYLTTTSTSKKITGLTSKKTYYIKVRAYKTVDGKKYYGSYSNVISCKVK